MATRSAAKAHRQSLKKRLRNRQIRSATKSTVKQAVTSITSITSGDMDAARNDVRIAIRELDRTASKGVVHPNNAARRKSRLLLKYNAAVAALQTTAAEKPKQAAKQAAKRKPAQRKPAQRRTSRTASAKKAKG